MQDPRIFDAAVTAAAREHALAQYPKESCGIVISCAASGVGGAAASGAQKYVPLENTAEDPESHFRLPADWASAHGSVQAIVHSHCFPRHGASPSAADMAAQMSAALPFGIAWTDGQVAGYRGHEAGPADGAIIWWGDFLLDDPLFDATGNHRPRVFLHGVNDCYSLIRAWYWQERKVRLPEFPRDPDWWKQGGDLYRDGFGKAGFEKFALGPVAPRDVKVGDIVLMGWAKWPVPFHAAIVLENGLMLHHPFNQISRKQSQFSRREPLNRWTKQVTHWLRYTG